MDFTYTVIFEPSEESGYLAHVPTLNGVTTHGETLQETHAMAKDLIQGYIESLIRAGQPIPRETECRTEGERITVTLTASVT